MTIGGICAACGLPGHRYGTTDREHDYSATACINGLLFELGVMGAVALELARWRSHDLAVSIVAEAVRAEKERVYAEHR